MFILRFLWAVLTSRWLWTLIGLALLVAISGSSARSCSVGDARAVRLREGAHRHHRAAGHLLAGLADRRAAPGDPRQPHVRRRDRRTRSGKAAQPRRRERRRRRRQVPEVMAELKRRKLGGRKFLREMPWYVIVGPPATGKTTALAPVRPQLPDRPHRRSAGRRRHAQLRLVLLRERGPDRHRRPLCPAGEPARCRRGRMAGLPRPAEEAPRPPRAERRDRRAVDRRALRRATKPSRRMAARSAGGWPNSTTGSKSACRSI